MKTQAEKGRAFRALHERDHAFIIPNPWDKGTARILAHLGFEALATTSMGYAFSCGQRDTTIGRERMLQHVAEIASVTDLPVSADLENGYGDAPQAAAETIRLAGAAGAAGAQSKMPPGAQASPSMDWSTRQIESARPWSRRVHFHLPLRSQPERKTICMAARTWLTPSAACRPTRRRARTYSMLRAWPPRKTSPRS